MESNSLVKPLGEVLSYSFKDMSLWKDLGKEASHVSQEHCLTNVLVTSEDHSRGVGKGKKTQSGQVPGAGRTTELSNKVQGTQLHLIFR